MEHKCEWRTFAFSKNELISSGIFTNEQIEQMILIIVVINIIYIEYIRTIEVDIIINRKIYKQICSCINKQSEIY